MESLNNPDYSKAIEVVSEIKLGDSDHVSTENQFVKKQNEFDLLWFNVNPPQSLLG